MRQIFADSSVIIAGAFSRTGASRAVLSMAEIGLYNLVVSRWVIDECERNLRAKLPDALAVFAHLLANTNLVIVENPAPDITAQWFPHIEAKDAPILAAAVEARVDRLLTLNTKDFMPQMATVSGLQIQTPGEFIREIRVLVSERLL